MIRLLLLLLCANLFAETVCLNMIVKDEKEVICRCLNSVKSFIDYWVIVDTGSKDGTEKVIKEYLKDIPGELHERPWVNFGHNRNEAMELAKGKGDYLFFVDADEVFSSKIKTLPSQRDYYSCAIRQGGCLGKRIFLAKNDGRWKWEGVIHETLNCSTPLAGEFLAECEISADAKDGNRSKDPKKDLKDLSVLLKAHEEEPDNSRYVFYIAQTYSYVKKHKEALQYYEKRSQMKGDSFELFWSYYQIGCMQELLGRPAEEYVRSYSVAFEKYPNRVEPLFRLMKHYYKEKNYALGYIIGKHALTLKNDLSNVGITEEAIHSPRGLHLLLANCAIELGKEEETRELLKHVVNQDPSIPDVIRKTICQ